MNIFIKKISLTVMLSLLSACVAYTPPYYASQPAYRSNYVVGGGYYPPPVYRGGYVIRRNFYGQPGYGYRPPYYNRPPYYRPPYNHPPHFRSPPYNHPPYYRPDPTRPGGPSDPSRPRGPMGRDPYRPPHSHR